MLRGSPHATLNWAAMILPLSGAVLAAQSPAAPHSVLICSINSWKAVGVIIQVDPYISCAHFRCTTLRQATTVCCLFTIVQEALRSGDSCRLCCEGCLTNGSTQQPTQGRTQGKEGHQEGGRKIAEAQQLKPQRDEHHRIPWHATHNALHGAT